MDYMEWRDLHAKSKLEIVKRNNLKSIDEIVEYFKYDNMLKNEVNFCPLYIDKIKCHDLEKLNCYYCGCPHIVINTKYNENEEKVIRSFCSINSVKAKEYYEYKENNNLHIHCDCSDCFIPHSDKFIYNMLTINNDEIKLSNSVSILDYLKRNQEKIKSKMTL